MSKVYMVKSACYNYEDYEEKVECVSLDEEVIKKFKNKYNRNLKSKKDKFEKIKKKDFSERSKKEKDFLNLNYDIKHMHNAWIEEYELV